MGSFESTIIITGGGQGTGAAFARYCVERGYRVALIGRSSDKLVEVQKELARIQAGAITIHAVDLTNCSATEEAFKAVFAQHPSIRALVNCVGTWLGQTPARELTAQTMRSALDLNFLTAVNCTQQVLSPNCQRAEELAIIHLGATASLQGWPKLAPFCVSKTAIRIYAQSLARELGPEGIHVAHVVIDGLIDNLRTRTLNAGARDDQFISQSSLSRALMGLIEQDRSCWTFELEVRPYNEEW